jgi:subtilisin family serine protease
MITKVHTRIFAAFVLLILALSLLPIPLSADGGGDYVETQLIVRLEDATTQTIDDVNADYGTTTLDVIPALGDIYLLEVAPGDDAVVVANLMDPSGSGGDPRIEYAEANYLSDLPEANPQADWAWGGEDPSPTGTQYAPGLINLWDAHALGQQGYGVTVAVVDTGFELDHPFLIDFWTLERYDFFDDDGDPTDEMNGLDDDGDAQIDEAFGHGTHVAGIVHQVAPLAQLMPIRAVDTDGRSNLWLIGEALFFAIDNGADVVNFSLGTDYDSEMLLDLSQQAAFGDVVVVAAAGNLDTNEQQFPAAYPDAIAVTAVDENLIRAPFANYGTWVDMAAPGVGIFSSFPGGYAWWSGTSMATPFVAGEAAVLRATDPLLTPAQVRTVLESTAIAIDAQNPAYVDLLGAGLTDVGAAVTSIVPPGDLIYISLTESDVVGGISAEAGDILGFYTGTNSWFPFFDSAAIGIDGNNIDAFLIHKGKIVMSFAATTTLAGAGTVEPSDLVMYRPEQQRFSLIFDGSDVGLTTADENVDAVTVINGRIVVSTSGPFDVTGVSGEDEDFIALSDATLGSNTSGVWSLYFDGSNSGLDGDDNRDLVAVWYDRPTNSLYFSTAGSFDLNGISITPTDIYKCQLTGGGASRQCDNGASGLFWHGNLFGLSSGIDGLSLVPNAPLNLVRTPDTGMFYP